MRLHHFQVGQELEEEDGRGEVRDTGEKDTDEVNRVVITDS